MLAQQQAQNRKMAGIAVTVGGVATYAITQSLTTASAGEYMPDGAMNAANADPRIFNVTPADFTTRPAEGAVVVFLGTNYTVVRVMPDIYGGVNTAWRLVAYRAPQDIATPNDAAQLAKFNYVAPP
jgi:hypothetical protein